MQPGFGPGGGPQRRCDTRNINNAVDNACADVIRRLNVDDSSFSPEVQAEMFDSNRRMICRKIHSNGMDPAMAQPHTDEGSFNEIFLDSVLQELIEQPDNSFNCLSSFVAATDASMRFSAVLPVGGSAIASSSQPVPRSNSNNNNVTNITSIENTGSVDGSTGVEGWMSLGG